MRVLPGTDAANPGFVLLRELELYGEAGIAANEVLLLATIESARHMGVDQSLGSISPNKKAYLIIVDGDPIKNLADLYKVDTVMKGAAIFKPAEIHEAFNIKPFDRSAGFRGRAFPSSSRPFRSPGGRPAGHEDGRAGSPRTQSV